MVERPRIEEASATAKYKALCFLHYRYIHSEDIVFSVKEIMEAIGEKRIGVVRYALDQLYKEGELIEDGAEYYISDLGISDVEQWDDDSYDRIAEGINFYEDTTQEDLINGPDETGGVVPASDRVVQLNDNSEPYKETLSALETAIQEFKDDHHLGNELGPEKDALINILEGGKKFLTDTKIRVEDAQNFIIEPLKRIDAIYKASAVTAAVTVAVSKAIDLVLALLGLA